MEKTERTETRTIALPRHFSGPMVKDTVNVINRLFENEIVGQLILDFSSTELVDSSAIGSLVSMAKEAHNRKIEFVLKNLNDEIYQIFNHTGLDKIFNIDRQKRILQATEDFFEPSVDIKLNIDKEFKDDIAVFHLKGVMNHPIGSAFFKQQFLLSLTQYKKILLDMEELLFIDSLSLSSILAMNNLLMETGGSMRICNANYIVLDLLETLKIDKVIPLYTSLKDALAKWEEPNG